MRSQRRSKICIACDRRYEYSNAGKYLNHCCAQCISAWRSRWNGIVRRCNNPLSAAYSIYGARGISVCERWLRGDGKIAGLICFIIDMGAPPSGAHSIDRIDNNGNYEPKNCRWATPKEQASNRSGIRQVRHDGETITVAEWARRTGTDRRVVYSRISNGWSQDDALMRPVKSHEKKHMFFTKEQLTEIQHKLSAGERVTSIAAHYGVSHSAISYWKGKVFQFS